MNKNSNPIGLEKLSIFITADALLAAILLVWAQLWVAPKMELSYLSAGLGLAWTYSAVLLALVALAWAGWRSLEKPSDKTPALSIGFFSTSIVMAIVDVFQSVASILRKLWGNVSIYKSLQFTPCVESLIQKYSVVFLVTGIAIILCVSLFFAYKRRKCLFWLEVGITMFVLCFWLILSFFIFE